MKSRAKGQTVAEARGIKKPANSAKKEYVGMPEYDNVKDAPPEVVVTFKFKTKDDFNLFNKIITKTLFDGVKPFDGRQTKTLKSTWFPHKQKASKYKYRDKKNVA